VLPSPADPPPPSLGLLVLCPNAALCDQVVAVCNDVFARGGLKLSAARVGGGGSDGSGGSSDSPSFSSQQRLPYPPPDVTVATPAGLLGATYAAGGGASWSPAAVISRTRAVVLDEADALLGGGYARDSRRVLEGMRAADEGVRLASARAWLEAGKSEDPPPPAWKDLPQKARRAARDGGAGALALELRSSGSLPCSEIPPALPRRQYVFAAATMPEDPRMTEAGFGVVEGGKRRKDSRRSSNSAPAGAMLRKEFPEAEWVGGFALHRPTPSVEHVWVDLDDEEEGEVEGTNRGSNWARALVEAVASPPPPPPSASTLTWPATTTLVFARTAGAAAEVCAKLRASGIDALEYSSAVSLADRKRALAALRKGGAEAQAQEGGEGAGVVVVATDAAARGLDLGFSSSGVDHVVQADFAANAVDWLHRVGRTGRGPRGGGEGAAVTRRRGRVTCLVSGGDAALADAIRGALEEGRPVDGSFSRNRSFRNKLKKYGEFVPRGEVFKGGGGGGGGGR
jgi:superfamily II DNA/RNA helicase